MICQWAKLFTQLMRSRMTISSGVSNGSAAFGYNTSVPSEPQIDVCLAQLPKGEKNPLSARARSSQVEKRTVKIGVGLLPNIQASASPVITTSCAITPAFLAPTRSTNSPSKIRRAAPAISVMRPSDPFVRVKDSAFPRSAFRLQLYGVDRARPPV
jgi:hypothetical protein